MGNKFVKLFFGVIGFCLLLIFLKVKGIIDCSLWLCISPLLIILFFMGLASIIIVKELLKEKKENGN